ncbi:hypothetical protein WAI453_005768 [Rhynchosporium graminicola]|uniref:Uncharacterized protein n=1 Tax=Rhynchosporium graminicola TaxID=2792576 RepID=A0A1E1KNM3_9HELO|nr:uncharacterized protein RCO7_04154 [Rhynchosporium commune]
MDPPPPYSVSDSTAGTSPHPILTPASSQAANASVAARPLPSTASSIDETVYTPLYSPATSIQKNSVFSEEHEHVTSSAAEAFFDSRPARRTNPTAALKPIKISVTHRSEPKDIPFPPGLGHKDVSELDWLTFVNYLLPDHAAGVNNDVADRKLKAELVDERMYRLTLGKDSRSMTDLREVEAQLDPLRQPLAHPDADISHRLEATISEWNEGFFIPRGLQISNICLQTEAARDGETTPLPGSWIPWEHEMNGEAGPTSNSYSRKGFFGGIMQAGSQGFKMGPIVADTEGFRIGRNGLRADTKGFRLGNMLVADSNGFRIGGSRGLNAGGNGVSLGGRSWGRRESHDPESGRGERHKGHRERSRSHGRRRRRRRRSASASSDSSSSSSSSSASDSSVGSLPEYEDLRDGQLPVAKQSLMEWLNHPDQPITKASVRDMREDISYAKDKVPQHKGLELSALRKEVRDLTKLFKDAKNAQRRDCREVRRGKKIARKAQRKERRAMKREQRQSKREDTKCGHGGARTGPPWLARASMMPTPFLPTTVNVPPNASSTFACSPFGAPPMPFRPSASNVLAYPSHSEHPGFPFGRSASAPFIKSLPFGLGKEGSAPGLAAMHNGWPFTHNASYDQGLASSSTPVPHGAERIHDQALQMEKSAELKESKAIDLRTAATGSKISEREKVMMRHQAGKLEEEAEKYRREVDRLRAEAMHLDGEMARGLQEAGGG